MSSTTATTPATTNEGESLSDHCIRSIKNCLQHSLFCLNKSKGQTLIQKVKLDIESRKKVFGVEYMDALRRGDNEALDGIVKNAMTDLAALDEKIAAYEDEIVAAEKTKDEAIAKNNEAVSPTKVKPTDDDESAASPAPAPAAADPAPEPAPAPAPAAADPAPAVEATE